jgi:uncharacterized protein YoxC
MIVEIVLIIACVILALLAGFVIPLLIELKRTTAQARTFLERTETQLNATLGEMDETLKSVRGITDTVNNVTDDIGTFSSSLAETGESVRDLFVTLSETMDRLSGNLSGIRAGIRAAVDIIATKLLKKRGK